MVRREEDDGREHEGGHDRADGNGDRQPAWLVETSLDAHHGSPSPPPPTAPTPPPSPDPAARPRGGAPSYTTPTGRGSAGLSSGPPLKDAPPPPSPAAPRKGGAPAAIPGTPTPRAGDAATTR